MLNSPHFKDLRTPCVEVPIKEGELTKVADPKELIKRVRARYAHLVGVLVEAINKYIECQNTLEVRYDISDYKYLTKDLVELYKKGGWIVNVQDEAILVLSVTLE